MQAEEARVHEITHKILGPIQIPGLSEALNFYAKWRKPFDGLRNPS